MFTGLIEEMGSVCAVEKSAAEWLLRIRSGLALDAVRIGDSIAVSGACLTVVAWRAGEFAVQVSSETLRATTLGNLMAGSAVNLERALRVGDRLDGHLVQGHVDAVGRVERIAPRGRSLEIWFRVPEAAGRYIVPKGSIAVDGVSLTVNQVVDAGDGTRFSINLIPHSQKKTTLATLAAGREVNVETDLLGRYVERLLGRGASARCGAGDLPRRGLDEAFLQQKGF
ncbi:MAG: riboflavin synthase [Magnetococcales bacterium]|nr:riboflavin synthase [Magnetococcales bacterium]